jgi:cation-transporting ATPase E
VPVTRTYFGLTAPDPPVIYTVVPTVVLWFVTLSVVLRFGALERLLGIPTVAPDPATRTTLIPSSQECS